MEKNVERGSKTRWMCEFVYYVCVCVFYNIDLDRGATYLFICFSRRRRRLLHSQMKWSLANEILTTAGPSRLFFCHTPLPQIYRKLIKLSKSNPMHFVF